MHHGKTSRVLADYHLVRDVTTLLHATETRVAALVSHPICLLSSACCQQELNFSFDSGSTLVVLSACSSCNEQS